MFDLQNKPPSLTSQVQTQSVIKGVRTYWVWLIVIISLTFILIIGWLYWQSQNELQKTKDQLKNQQKVPADVSPRDENKQLVEKVGKLIILPANEEPDIATVIDLNKLKDQPFFAKAQVGDKVLIYSQAKKAVLYRPSTNEVIELAPLLDGTNTPASPQAQ
jgi:hypothetical protein